MFVLARLGYSAGTSSIPERPMNTSRPAKRVQGPDTWRRLLAALLIALLSLGSTGCGDDGDSGQGDTGAEEGGDEGEDDNGY
jgi:hypothetical protein